MFPQQAYLMQDYEAPIREMISSFGAVNLERAIETMNPQVQSVRQYIRFHPGGVPVVSFLVFHF